MLKKEGKTVGCGCGRFVALVGRFAVFEVSCRLLSIGFASGVLCFGFNL
jgi:hypothetical protein